MPTVTSAESDDQHSPTVNPWHPITDPVTLKHMGKLNEELGELISAVARCQIQGVDESDPGTGKLNREWLQEELADAQCGIELLIDHLQLDREAIASRMAIKAERLRAWHKMA